ncbi:hypothetical protein [Kitasatospora sp. NPDC056181]|uniref:hypothetical protein n=1 Tax=Kitasatospora sp. NPDC056181 TaxID=3345737 RepID=UPI0035DCE783
MRVDDAADRFWVELRDLWEAAGPPPLKTAVRLGEVQVPPVTISDSTINGWLTRVSVPSERFTGYFEAFVPWLQRQAGQTPTRQSGQRWAQLLAAARAEQKRKQGSVSQGSGRPAPAVAAAPAAAPPTAPNGAPGIDRHRRMNFYRAGCGVGWKLHLAPLSESSGGIERLAEFLETLRTLGFPPAEIERIEAYTSRIPAAESNEVGRALVVEFAAAMDGVVDLARELSSAEEFNWFTLGRLLHTIGYVVTIAWPDDPDIEGLRSGLFFLADLLKVPEAFRAELKAFATMPMPTPNQGDVFLEAHRLGQVCEAIL